MSYTRKAHTRIKNNKVEEVKEHQVNGEKISPYSQPLFEDTIEELEYLLNGYDIDTQDKQQMRAMVSNKKDELNQIWKVCNKDHAIIIRLVENNIYTSLETKKDILNWKLNTLQDLANKQDVNSFKSHMYAFSMPFVNNDRIFKQFKFIQLATQTKEDFKTVSFNEHFTKLLTDVKSTIKE